MDENADPNTERSSSEGAPTREVQRAGRKRLFRTSEERTEECRKQAKARRKRKKNEETRLKEELERCTDSLAASQKQVDTLTNENSLLQTDLKEATARCERLQFQLTHAQEPTLKLQVLLAKKAKQVKDLAKALSLQEEEANKYAQEVKGLRAVNTTAIQQTRELEAKRKLLLQRDDALELSNEQKTKLRRLVSGTLFVRRSCVVAASYVVTHHQAHASTAKEVIGPSFRRIVTLQQTFPYV